LSSGSLGYQWEGVQAQGNENRRKKLKKDVMKNEEKEKEEEHRKNDTEKYIAVDVQNHHKNNIS
jgi:hypothetical protein